MARRRNSGSTVERERKRLIEAAQRSGRLHLADPKIVGRAAALIAKNRSEHPTDREQAMLDVVSALEVIEAEKGKR